MAKCKALMGSAVKGLKLIVLILGGYVALMALVQRPDIFKVKTLYYCSLNWLCIGAL